MQEVSIGLRLGVWIWPSQMYLVLVLEFDPLVWTARAKLCTCRHMCTLAREVARYICPAGAERVATMSHTSQTVTASSRTVRRALLRERRRQVLKGAPALRDHLRTWACTPPVAWDLVQGTKYFAGVTQRAPAADEPAAATLWLSLPTPASLSVGMHPSRAYDQERAIQRWVMASACQHGNICCHCGPR